MFGKGSANRIAILILLGIDACAYSAVCSHGLIPIFAKVEYFLLGIVMHTLDHLWSYQRALGDNSFQRYHTVEVCRAQGPRIAGEFAEAADESAVVHLLAI